eukprot:575050-Prorocentrum_minimum.AAC.1
MHSFIGRVYSYRCSRRGTRWKRHPAEVVDSNNTNVAVPALGLSGGARNVRVPRLSSGWRQFGSAMSCTWCMLVISKVDLLPTCFS